MWAPLRVQILAGFSLRVAMFRFHETILSLGEPGSLGWRTYWQSGLKPAVQEKRG